MGGESFLLGGGQGDRGGYACFFSWVGIGTFGGHWYVCVSILLLYIIYIYVSYPGCRCTDELCCTDLKYRIIINNNIMHYQYIDRKAKAADLAI